MYKKIHTFVVHSYKYALKRKILHIFVHTSALIPYKLILSKLHGFKFKYVLQKWQYYIFLHTNTRLFMRGSKSLLVGDVPRTYSTIFTPKPPVSEDRGDNILPTVSAAGKLPDLRVTINGCETPCSERPEKNKNEIKLLLA